LVLTLSYDGAAFAGSQIQPRARTVQGELERALAEMGFGDARTVFAGRTDTGVHAAGQVAACDDRRPDLSVTALRTSLNAVLADDLAVEHIERREGSFHPRYDAKWREYRYRIWSGERQPMARAAVWHRRSRLDGDLMAAAAIRFIGTRDFASIAGGGEGVPWAAARTRQRGTVRTVLACTCRPMPAWWKPADDEGCLYEVSVVADGFLPRMVRTMTALIVDAGRGAVPVAAIDEILAATDRRLGGGTAPAHGLTLWRIGYTEWSPFDLEG
jgi:tRNA pseudouridine38-40 synthase